MAALSRWPVRLQHGDLELRPLRLRDAGAWREVRMRNADWIRPWEATLPDADGAVPATYGAMVRYANREARAGRMLPFALFERGRLIGQVTVTGIVLGSLRSGQIGYWIDKDRAGRGIMPTAVATVADYCFSSVGLHRVEINIRPENGASLAVVRKLGFRMEGVRERYLHIDGRWRDHLSFALTAEERPNGLVAWLEQRKHGA